MGRFLDKSGVAIALSLGLVACGADGDPRSDAGTRTDSSTNSRLDVVSVTDGSPNRDGNSGDQVIIPPVDSFVVIQPDASENQDGSVVEGGGIYDDVMSTSDVRMGCNPAMCTPVADNCLATEVCDNGLDDNCNGKVDEAEAGCTCIPGEVQQCFLGPPGRAAITNSQCRRGSQTCRGTEIGSWGDCTGAIAPSGEACDMLDNDCDGCADENLCCTGDGTCPGPNDPRVPTNGRPFGTVTLSGRSFLQSGTRFQWHVEGGPCDRLLYATSRAVSYSLQSGTTTTPLDYTGETLNFRPTLSGDYTVTFTGTRPDNTTLTCTFNVPVRAPGFRVELCWDTTGRDDVDLWVKKPGTTSSWPNDPSVPDTLTTGETCYYGNCRNLTPRSDLFGPIDSAPNWGYTATSGGACREPTTSGACLNPRLDIDNIRVAGIPENINVDNPRANERFRIAVNYFQEIRTPNTVHAVQPMVNIYCGGQLRATYGGANGVGTPATNIGAAPVMGFDRPGDDRTGSLWRVADVTMLDATRCSIQPLRRTGTTGGYCVESQTTAAGHTFSGPCVPGPAIP